MRSVRVITRSKTIDPPLSGRTAPVRPGIASHWQNGFSLRKVARPDRRDNVFPAQEKSDERFCGNESLVAQTPDARRKLFGRVQIQGRPRAAVRVLRRNRNRP